LSAAWFIEESLPDGTYRVIAAALNEEQALAVLVENETSNRLEMWSRALADSPKGFAPAAFKSSGKVFIGNTLKMLGGIK
jgi:hypothetical protein